jgi:hypothetical protein
MIHHFNGPLSEQYYRSAGQSILYIDKGQYIYNNSISNTYSFLLIFLTIRTDPVVVIPSTFFIADTGVPVEVIAECGSHNDFLAKVRTAVKVRMLCNFSFVIDMVSMLYREDVHCS